mmetsp:Transcript_41686/g.47504  ORF Transcript_41686/g.47504 Transcript_41686/m.47504 type:complete len:87 (-) Transcript_41686:324-584(-)
MGGYIHVIHLYCVSIVIIIIYYIVLWMMDVIEPTRTRMRDDDDDDDKQRRSIFLGASSTSVKSEAVDRRKMREWGRLDSPPFLSLY